MNEFDWSREENNKPVPSLFKLGDHVHCIKNCRMCGEITKITDKGILLINLTNGRSIAADQKFFEKSMC